MSYSTVGARPSPTELHLAPELRDDLDLWVREGYPHEACGLLIGRTAGGRVEVDRAVRARNLNRERADDRYQLDPEDFLAADEAARGDGLEIVGIWHSHPDCPARPSTTDLEAAWEGYSYLIVGVTRSGETDLRSWRLDGEVFLNEKILPEDPRPPVAALRFENPLKEERLS